MHCSTACPSELVRLNEISVADFVIALGGLFEHSPWVAERAAVLRPFKTARQLHDAMVAGVRSADEAQQLKLIRAHPELAGKEAAAGTLTDASTSEQNRLGLTRLDAPTFNRLADLNARYRDTFGFPCIIALRQHATVSSVLADFEHRLNSSRTLEIDRALDEISVITRGRLAQYLGLPGDLLVGDEPVPSRQSHV